MTHIQKFPKLKKIFKLFKGIKEYNTSTTSIYISGIDSDIDANDDDLVRVHCDIEVICTMKEFKDILARANNAK